MDFFKEEMKMEQIRKQHAMNLLGEALGVGNRWFNFRVSEDQKVVEMEDIRSGAKRHININGDNIPAMLRDVMDQAIDWIL